MADPHTDLVEIVGTLIAMILEVHARQIALAGFLRDAGTLDEPRYRTAIREADAALSQRPGVASFRSQIDAGSLAVLERTLRDQLLAPRDR